MSTTNLEQDVIRQREQLAETVEALGRKLDVKTRAHDKAADLKDSATTSTGAPRPELLAIGAAVLAVAAGLVWLRVRR